MPKNQPAKRTPGSIGRKPSGDAKTCFRPVRFRETDDAAIGRFLKATNQKFSPWLEGLAVAAVKAQGFGGAG